MIKSPHPLLDAPTGFINGCILMAVFWVIVIAIALLVWTSVSAQDGTLVWNCGNPEGLIVQPSGRIIEQGEIFVQIGDEIVNYETGVSSVNVYDGTISGQELFICEALR
jgi:hypothetical protein